MKKTDSLTADQLYVIRDKGTEAPFSGDYLTTKNQGTFLCRQCGAALFRADNQFTSHCGWPSYDDEITGTIKKVPDADGRRTEIVCAQCDAHLGHVFEGEGLTNKNLRHCVNSVSIEFVEDENVLHTEEAILAAGCFWGVQHYLDKLPGVLKTEVGYTGGSIEHPSYEQVCSKTTGHVEAIRVVFDSDTLSYESVLKYFFEIHDPGQADGQGPDIGPQYRSVIFYYNQAQHATASRVMQQLSDLGHTVVTELLPVSPFWLAEPYHQDYYVQNHKQPYCHSHQPKFPETQ